MKQELLRSRTFLLWLGLATTILIGAAIVASIELRPRASPVASSSQQLDWFVDVTQSAGAGGYRGQTYGASWGDANGDGFADLWASGHSPQRLFMNNGGVALSDVAKERVTPIRYSDRHNAAWADVDNDGDDDLIQLSGAGRGEAEDPNALYLNEGGQLRDDAEQLGLTYSLARARAALWLDLDLDARLDVIMTAAPRQEAPPSLFRWAPSGQFVRTPLAFLEASEVAQLSHLTDEAALHLITGAPHKLFVHEVREGQLIDVGAQLGLTELPGYWVSDVLTTDLDNDLRPDFVFVRGTAASDVEQPEPSRLRARLQSYRGQPQRISFQGPGQLSVQPYPVGKHWWGKGKLFIGADGHAPDAMPVTLRAADAGVHGLSEGDAGLYLGYDEKTRRWIIETRAPEWDSVNLELEADQPIANLTTDGFDPALRPLPQFVQWNGPTGFGPADAEVLPPDNCLAGAAGDFDNDMDVDLYLVCSDYLSNSANLLLENLGNRRFRRVPDAGGAAGSDLGIGESVAIADYDVDGFLDLFVRNGYELPPFGKGPDQLFRNLGNANHWLELDLEGTQGNRNGIGARVTVSAGGVEQMRVADNGVHGRVQDFRRLHFGLAANTIIDWVRVDWPNGRSVRYQDVGVDTVWTLREDGQASRRFPVSGSNLDSAPVN